MKVQTTALTGKALNWAVSKALGFDPFLSEEFDEFYFKSACDYVNLIEFNPSTNWEQGGPILDEASIDLTHYLPSRVNENMMCRASLGDRKAYGSTSLIAAMRCLVATNLGDEIDVPEQLA